MGILDELMECKDLNIYLGLRIEYLKEGMNILETLRPKKREAVHRQIKGRVKELRRLKRLLGQRKIREESKKLWKILHKDCSGDAL